MLIDVFFEDSKYCDGHRTALPNLESEGKRAGLAKCVRGVIHTRLKDLRGMS